MNIARFRQRMIVSGLVIAQVMFTIFSGHIYASTVNGKEISSYLPILEKTKNRIPSLDSITGLYVKEVKENLFFVTDGVYQSAFLKTKKGVVVFDAPADYGKKLPEIIKQNIPDKEIRYLIYSHGHKDHIGASGVFKSIEGLQIIAQEAVSNSIKRRKNPDILQPNIVFENEYILSLGQEEIELKNQGNFHSTDADTFIYLPKQKALIAIDILSPGYAPFKNFEITLDFHRYLTVYDTVLAYDFELILTGHLGIWGVRQDVLDSREYVHDVEATAKYILEKTAAGDLFGKVDTELKGNSHSDLAYRYYLEVMAAECADQVINKWTNRLAGVDVWADGHCETALIYSLLH